MLTDTTILFMVLFSVAYGSSDDSLADLYCCMVDSLSIQGAKGTTNIVPISELISCKEIKQRDPASQTGYYPMIADGKIFVMYCNMDTLCGSDGGWSRIGYLNMSSSHHQCPDKWDEYTKDTGGIRTCRKKLAGVGCDSVVIPSLDLPYSEVCGRVVGYQYASTDSYQLSAVKKDIDKPYIDGVSITHGSPRQHIWTLMSGTTQNGIWGTNKQICPCHRLAASRQIVSFIGNDWYCESGNPQYQKLEYKPYMDDVLWDGQNCEPDELECCKNKLPGISQPWFHKALSTETTDHLEIRICGNEARVNEDILVTMYEFYTK